MNDLFERFIVVLDKIKKDKRTARLLVESHEWYCGKKNLPMIEYLESLLKE